METGFDGASLVRANPLLTFRLTLLAEFVAGCIIEGIEPDEDTWEMYLLLHMPNPHRLIQPSLN